MSKESNGYIEFLTNYPENNPLWYEGVKYRIKKEDDEHYYISCGYTDFTTLDQIPIPKFLQDAVYMKKYIVKGDI